MSGLTQPNPPPVDLRSPAAGRVALKGFFGITEDWGLGRKEQQNLLGDIARPTLEKYRLTPPVKLTRDTIDRISYIFGIHKALRILFSDKAFIAQWLRHPNELPPFNGQPVLDYMLKNGLVGLADTRRFLDSWRG